MVKLGFIQEHIGSFLLNIRTKRNDRKPQVFTFENAQTIGILCDANETNTFTKVVEFAQFIQKKHCMITTEILAFSADGNIAQNQSQQTGIHYFTKNDFSWSGALLQGEAQTFCQKNFNILIDLTTETSYPTNYVELVSKASYKVGRYIENDMRYDLMIDTQEDGDISYLITQINVYLSKIRVKQ